jgi:hypothetical protein
LGASDVFGHQNFRVALFTNTYGVVALAVVPVTVVPLIVIEELGVIPYVTGFDAVLVTVGCGAATVNPLGRFSPSPPPETGLTTWTVYDPGWSALLGHQNFN